MRQIILDTETTGLSAEAGHRIIEIGCVELINRKITGKTYHQYINPQRELEEAAIKVHGITQQFLEDKPLFTEISLQFIEFVEGAEIIIHNAPFDTSFINSEFSRLENNTTLIEEISTITDTLVMARKLFPGQRNSLDALCKRFKVDNSNREWHGALLDSELLAKVYIHMTAGQADMFSTPSEEFADNVAVTAETAAESKNDVLQARVTAEESGLHQAFLKKIHEKSGSCFWLNNEK